VHGDDEPCYVLRQAELTADVSAQRFAIFEACFFLKPFTISNVILRRVFKEHRCCHVAARGTEKDSSA
jgi:hypothetical protein